MSDKSDKDIILFKFEDEEESKSRNLPIKRDMLIEDALKAYLRETNSVMTLDLEKIQFLNKSKLLNNPNILKEKVGKVYNRSVMNVKIQVKDPGNVVGGKY